VFSSIVSLFVSSKVYFIHSFFNCFTLSFFNSIVLRRRLCPSDGGMPRDLDLKKLQVHSPSTCKPPNPNTQTASVLQTPNITNSKTPNKTAGVRQRHRGHAGAGAGARVCRAGRGQDNGTHTHP